MFEVRQNTSSSPMDELDGCWDSDEDTMSEEHKHESSTGGLTEQKVQQHLNHFYAMCRSPNNSPTPSEESICTYGSGCSNSDSDISEVITFDVQNVDEEIKKVCQRFLDPENLEEEAEHSGEKTDVSTAETGSVTSEGSEIPAPTASSPYTSSPITEAATMVVSQVIEEAVRIIQTTEAVRKIHTNDSDMKAEKPAGRSFFKKLKSVWKSRFGRKKNNKVKQVSEQDVDKAKFDLSSTPLEPIEEEEDTTENKNFVPSPASNSSFSSEGKPGGQEEYENNEVGGPEDLKERDKVCIIKKGSTSRLSATLEESERATSSASSSFTSSTIFKVANMIVAQVIQQAAETLESTDSERPARKKFIKKVKAVWKYCFGKKQRKNIKTVSECQVDEASPKPDLTATPLKGQKEQDETPAEHQRSFSLQQQFAEPHEEDQGMETNLPPGPSEKDGHTAADQQLILNSADIADITRRFFQSFTEEQWRAVSEGVYGQDLKEQLNDMYMDLNRFISESLTKNVLQAIRQPSTTSGTSTPRSPLLQNIRTSFESSFTQAICDVVGVNTPVRVSPEFTEAITGEVTEEVNSVLSVAISSSVTAPASSWESKDKATSKDKTLARGCKTKKGKRCLRKNVMVHPAPVEDLNEAVTSRSTQDSKQISQSPQEKSPTTSPSTALWRSSPLVLVDVEDEDTTEEETRDVVSSLSSTRSILTGHQVFEGPDNPPLAEITADEDQENMSYQSNKSGDKDEEETSSQISASQNKEPRAKKSNGFCSFFRSIFSKKDNKKEKKMARAKRPPLWSQLFCCSVCSCCFDN